MIPIDTCVLCGNSKEKGLSSLMLWFPNKQIRRKGQMMALDLNENDNRPHYQLYYNIKYG